MTKLEIIQETVEFYSKDPRSTTVEIDGSVRCMYKGVNGAECAFQRCVETNLSNFEGKNASSIMGGNVRGAIPVVFKEQYKGHEEQPTFWRRLQMLHDHSEYWEKNLYNNQSRLSITGNAYLQDLLKEFQS